jgi:penicillin-binding protein 1C
MACPGNPAAPARLLAAGRRGSRRLRAVARPIARGVLALAISGLCAFLLLIGLVWQRMPPLALSGASAMSVSVLDRDGRLLRAYTTGRGRWRLPIEPAAVDQRYLAMLIALEDKRFFSHRGVDARAMLRAGWQLLRDRRIVSGGSTLSMQVVRLLKGEHERSGLGKIRQALAALALERRLSKTDILALYLRLAPFGGNLEGVRAASLAYFGKEPRRLSLAQAALLVAVPQSPKSRRPDRFPLSAQIARDRVLNKAVAAGVISRADAMFARAERVPAARRAFPMLAAHLADAERARSPDRLVHHLTIDATAQAHLESLAREHASALSRRLSAALIALDNATGAVIADVGSAGYLDASRFGAVDMTGAVRSPGSTLKPLIYGLAFEAGLAHPETLIEDRPTRFGLYLPKNFDSDWHGTVSLRTALAQSLNIPAVKVLDALGPARLYGRLGQVGVTPVLPRDAEPSLAIALGGLGLTLPDLAVLYAGLARGGEPVRLSYRHEDAHPRSGLTPPRLLSEVAAWYVTDILRHAPAPAHAKPGEIAYKTGTSYGYRDAWAVGYDGRHTIAVWVGRADAGSTPGLTGRTAAAPLLFDAFQRLSPRRTPLRAVPAGALIASQSQLPPPLKRFRDGADATDPGVQLEPTVKIAFPPDRAELEVEEEEQPVVVTAEGGTLPLTWLVDGVRIGSDPARRQAELPPERRGFIRLSVIDAKGRADRVMLRLK